MAAALAVKKAQIRHATFRSINVEMRYTKFRIQKITIYSGPALITVVQRADAS
jgi:hypothetical protein